jgi:DNA-binding LacI/PurR family transcriptional regulator
MPTVTRSNYPVAVRVAHVLEDRITRGEYEVGAWLPTERALADEFQVDRSQIRVALQHLEGKSLITRAPGRRPVITDHRRERRSVQPVSKVFSVQTIAAILPQHPVYPAAAAILKGMQQALRHASEQQPRCRLMIFDTHTSSGDMTTALEHQALTALDEEDIAGAVFWSSVAGPSTVEVVHNLQAQGRPVVYVDRLPDGETGDFVGVDNRFAAREAVEYLIRLGHTRIAHLTNQDPVSPVADRGEGYREALRHADIPFDPALLFAVRSGMDVDVTEAVNYFLEQPEPPTAVFAMNDSLAHVLIQELEARGQRVPDDVSVIGFDDLERFSPRPALLTTIHQPFQRIGQRAAELLLQRIAGRQNGAETAEPLVGQHVLLPAPLVERATCASQ